MVNLGQLLNRYNKWMANLPQVQPFYAVKCNDDPVILKTLAALGCGFDCASEVNFLSYGTVESVHVYNIGHCHGI